MKRKAKRIAALSAKPPAKQLNFRAWNDDGFGTSVPPSIESVVVYFDQKSVLAVARDFYDEHESRKWKNHTGQPVTNWKVCAAEWIYNYRQETKRKFRKSPFYSESS